ncbi:MAG: hypothetical protein ACSW74_03735, partial [Spirochaetales bacterium]
FANNSSKECEGVYYVRLNSDLVSVLESKAGVDKVLCEKDGKKCVITKSVTVKAMHDIAAELRRKDADVFFAQIKG